MVGHRELSRRSLLKARDRARRRVMDRFVLSKLCAHKFATGANIESVLGVQEVIKEDLLTILLSLLDRWIVQSFFFLFSVKWIKLAYDGWSN